MYNERRESDAAASIVRDGQASWSPMAIVEKYEQFIAYFYPVLQNVPRKHGVARDMALTAMFQQVEMFATAGKAKQISRLYIADANLSALRFWLRFMADPGRRLITPQQHKVALAKLAEVGKMLGTWIKSMKSGG